jgi:hypothetical protein
VQTGRGECVAGMASELTEEWAVVSSAVFLRLAMVSLCMLMGWLTAVEVSSSKCIGQILYKR